MTRVGLISDTHGLVRPEALKALTGSQVILHAGDIGRGEVLRELEAIAPVRAIRGNVDRDGPASRQPDTLLTEIDGTWFYLVHDLDSLDLDPRAAGVDVVVYGHSHQPSLTERDGVLFVNPGSAGPRRFRLPVTVAVLQLADTGIQAEITPLLGPR